MLLPETYPCGAPRSPLLIGTSVVNELHMLPINLTLALKVFPRLPGLCHISLIHRLRLLGIRLELPMY